MFVDELTISAKAGNGGNGVVRWRHEKHRPLAGPSGGDGGNGGDVYVQAVKDLNRLSKYTGSKTFEAANGGHGMKDSLFGANGTDCVIEIPVGSTVTHIGKDRGFELTQEGERVKILKGGRGGFGNEHFKSATNQTPEEWTPGTKGEGGDFLIEVALVVDVGLIGLPNAGKSTLLNILTNAHSRIGAYPFTTLEPHLGALHEFVIADIPGLIEGASEGKGLGHRFLRHVSRTKTLLHLVSLENEDPLSTYYTIREELGKFNTELTTKPEWIILSKSDLVEEGSIKPLIKELEKTKNRVFVISQNDPDSIKILRDTLVKELRTDVQ